MSEEWRAIEGGYYSVSSSGRVRREKAEKGTQAGRLMSTYPDASGYLRVGITIDGRYRSKLVHRLVALAFLGPALPGKEVNHINGDKGDPRVENLEYVTRRENVRHAIRTGLFSPSIGKYPQAGTKNGRAKLNEDRVREIREMRAAGVGPKALAATFGISTAAVNLIVRRVNWRHVA